MLVLSRHRGEAIVIDGHIVVTVVDIRGDSVRIGVDAPREIPVNRMEVQEAIDRGETRAVAGPGRGR
jgi:carbon storage regulator